ncbi:hypothetical protein H0266_07755 [Halobacillus locisalis]|uniref:Regulatory protein YycH domain-containing protein n=1 Tax=Halobacillus locisalis TaxID=220753 RepID=A0A838CSE3_9BACI|nr:two-component system activity regulator YycH [Halobacillus locisalis]MBA2174783.1 hypothetical protein [Halobacillus locisalis]
MKIETMKSVILLILIAFSLLLSVALWNYQPSFEVDETKGSVGETSLDMGKEMTMRELLEPSQFVFHEDGLHYSYRDEGQQAIMYQNMRDWQLVPTDYNPSSTPDLEGRDYVEIIFPTSLPVQTLSEVMNTGDNQLPSNQSFDRLMLGRTTNSDGTTVYNVWVVNSQTDVNPILFRATIDSSSGSLLFNDLATKENLTEQIHFEASSQAEWNSFGGIYIAKESKEYPEVVLQTQNVPLSPLQNYLFPQPESVSRSQTSSGDYRYRSPERLLEVLEDEKIMNFQLLMPNTSNQVRIDEYELLTESIDDVNSHNGWTNDFRISHLTSVPDEVEFKMYYDDVEIMNHPLANIRLQYEQREIQEYIRPLVKFVFLEPRSTVQLESGEEVISQLSDMNINLGNIEAVKIGYDLGEQNSLAYSLQPKWFYKSSGFWTPVFQQSLSQNQNEASQ